jgi:hypothetical protein
MLAELKKFWKDTRESLIEKSEEISDNIKLQKQESNNSIKIKSTKKKQ